MRSKGRSFGDSEQRKNLIARNLPYMAKATSLKHAYSVYVSVVANAIVMSLSFELDGAVSWIEDNNRTKFMR